MEVGMPTLRESHQRIQELEEGLAEIQSIVEDLIETDSEEDEAE